MGQQDFEGLLGLGRIDDERELSTLAIERLLSNFDEHALPHAHDLRVASRRDLVDAARTVEHPRAPHAQPGEHLVGAALPLRRVVG